MANAERANKFAQVSFRSHSLEFNFSKFIYVYIEKTTNRMSLFDLKKCFTSKGRKKFRKRKKPFDVTNLFHLKQVSEAKVSRILLLTESKVGFTGIIFKAC